MKQGETRLSTEQLHERIEAASGRFPHAAQTCRDILRISPSLMRGQLTHLITRHDDAFWLEADRLIQLCTALGGSPAEALIEYTVEYLKEQVRFIQSDSYSHSDFDDVFNEVYGNREVMDKFYLPGLMLTHAFWPIHFDMHEFFREQFLSRVPDAGIGAEYGFGHGLYLLEVLESKPRAQARGFDISEFSLRYATSLLEHCGIAPSRYELALADVRQPLAAPDKTYQWAIFAEIIEHIPDPLASLRELRRCMAPGAPVFATTVLNSNAIDHIFLMRHVEDVHDLLQRAGFDILVERVLRVADYDGGRSKDPSVDVACVCVPAIGG